MLTRLPDFKSILPVYALISLMVYSWTILLLLWQIPSLLYKLSLEEIVGISAYSFSANLLECLFVLGGLLFLSMIVPSRFLKDDFIIRGTVIAVCMLGSAMLHLYLNRTVYNLENLLRTLRIWWGITILVMAILIWSSAKVYWLRMFIFDLTDRLIVLLYIFIPLSLLSFAIVIIRNL